MQVACSACGAVVAFPPGELSGRCAWCDSPQVASGEHLADSEVPRLVLGFEVTEEVARLRATRWLGSRRCPKALRRGRIASVRGVYLPAWLHTAGVKAKWFASLGYQVSETDTNGNQRTRLQWSGTGGHWYGWLSDDLVSGSAGLENWRLAQVEPFDLEALRRYRADRVSGWPVELPSQPRVEVARSARGEAEQRVRAEIEAHLGGELCQELTVDVTLEAPDLCLTLLPIWLVDLEDRGGERVDQLVVNGQSGQVGGSHLADEVHLLDDVAKVKKTSFSLPKPTATQVIVALCLLGIAMDLGFRWGCQGGAP